MISPTSALTPANIMLPVTMDGEGTPHKSSIQSMVHL
jgi:hypothetical protein